MFHPGFLHSVLASKPEDFEVIGAGIVGRIQTERSLGLLKHLYRLGGMAGIAAMTRRLAARRIGGLFSGAPSSVRAVFWRYRVPVRELMSPNQPDFVEWLANQRPDVVYCSVTNLLKSPMLSVPRVACINRHSGRLPDFRGAEPVFHALRLGEKSVTVTFHTMVEQLDGGQVLLEYVEPVRPSDTVFDLYERLFDASGARFWDAMTAAINSQPLRDIEIDGYPIYKRPKREEIAEFRRRGNRYV